MFSHSKASLGLQRLRCYWFKLWCHWLVAVSVINIGSESLVDSRGGRVAEPPSPVDWMHFNTSENFARKFIITA